MPQGVSRRPLTAQARVRSRSIPRDICGVQSGSGTDSPSTHKYVSFHPISIIPPKLHTHSLMSPTLYRVIRKSLRHFRPLRYSSRDGHAEGKHVNRGRGTTSFCPTLQVLDMSTLGDVADFNPVISFLPHTTSLFVSQRTGNHSAGISCNTHELFCP